MNYADMKNTKASVAQLQGYLDYIFRAEGQGPRLYPNGLYENRTKAAVSLFQHRYGLPVTRKVDRATWDAVVKKYEELKSARRAAKTPRIFPGAEYVVKPGEKSDVAAHIQLLLQQLSYEIDFADEIKCTGTYREEDARAVGRIQALCSLPVTGVVDLDTWDAIVTLYNNYAKQQEPE